MRTSFQEAIVTAKTDVESRLRGGASRNRRQRDHRVGNIMKKIRIHGNLGLKQTGRKSFINGLLGYYLFRISSFVIPPSPLQFPPPTHPLNFGWPFLHLEFSPCFATMARGDEVPRRFWSLTIWQVSYWLLAIGRWHSVRLRAPLRIILPRSAVKHRSLRFVSDFDIRISGFPLFDYSRRGPLPNTPGVPL